MVHLFIDDFSGQWDFHRRIMHRFNVGSYLCVKRKDREVFFQALRYLTRKGVQSKDILLQIWLSGAMSIVFTHYFLSITLLFILKGCGKFYLIIYSHQHMKVERRPIIDYLRMDVCTDNNVQPSCDVKAMSDM